jgi:hypothetical protein
MCILDTVQDSTTNKKHSKLATDTCDLGKQHRSPFPTTGIRLLQHDGLAEYQKREGQVTLFVAGCPSRGAVTFVHASGVEPDPTLRALVFLLSAT